MLETLLLSYALIFPRMGPMVDQQQGQYNVKEHTLVGVDAPKYERLFIETKMEPMKQPKLAPQNNTWKFPFVTSGYGRRTEEDRFHLRTRVFAENQEDAIAIGQPVSRMLMRIWDFNYQRLVRLDHKTQFRQGIYDIFLCSNGPDAGAEHRYERDPFETSTDGVSISTSAIYIYQIGSLTDPLEWARETAHEYGHATLLTAGGFSAPEPWPNGDLGERLYLKWLHEELIKETVTSDDVLGASQAQLASYVTRKYTPMINRFSQRGPRADTLQAKTEEGYFDYLAVALYMSAICETRMFARSMMLLRDQTKPEGYIKATIDAAAEKETWIVKIPAELKGKREFWLPVGKGKVSGGTVLEERDGWQKVKVPAGDIIITNPPIDPAIPSAS
jgi:hypothetical protein